MNHREQAVRVFLCWFYARMLLASKSLETSGCLKFLLFVDCLRSVQRLGNQVVSGPFCAVPSAAERDRSTKSHQLLHSKFGPYLSRASKLHQEDRDSWARPFNAIGFIPRTALQGLNQTPPEHQPRPHRLGGGNLFRGPTTQLLCNTVSRR